MPAQSETAIKDEVDATVIKGPGPGNEKVAPVPPVGSSPSSGSASSDGASGQASLASTLWSDAINTAEDIPKDVEVAFMALKGLAGEIHKGMTNAGHYASVDFGEFKILLGKAYGLAEKIGSYAASKTKL